MFFISRSTDWSCKTCGSHNADALLELNPEASHTPDAIDAEFIAQIAFKSEAEKKVDMEKQGKAAACSNDTKEAPTQTDTATQVNTQETLTRRSESADTPQAPPPASVGSASVAPVLTQRNTNAERIAQAQSEAPQPQPQTLSPRRPTYWGEIFLTILIWGVGIELLTMILIKFAV
ncbi:hypothetical protein SARC_13700 [Sphaeroforma arctica JP610]|uniref:Uncharacterized protein n=1 Tax=Sphaeroforma arctica JP610 TaxID=667725 RepID=A0A0L0FAH4_9EUKA|nr:hypothetical protein SARC_13700 [Sphaeroforma arctica JP610]KNC73744.1 hypothetical protein SARC_13700 [Sphaeroforma arctica JP610]|eukprot:XP_014147646.1 hypothetical protein SARC_13700 [Sphaeroforma arctica JP610]